MLGEGWRKKPRLKGIGGNKSLKKNKDTLYNNIVNPPPPHIKGLHGQQDDQRGQTLACYELPHDVITHVWRLGILCWHIFSYPNGEDYWIQIRVILEEDRATGIILLV